MADAKKKHFFFTNLEEASDAKLAWYAQQVLDGAVLSTFRQESNADGTDVSLVAACLADQEGFHAFLNAHYAGRFTVHDTSQVRSWLSNLFDQ